VWESFGDVGFPTSDKVWREKKRKLSATLERATIKQSKQTIKNENGTSVP